MQEGGNLAMLSEVVAISTWRLCFMLATTVPRSHRTDVYKEIAPPGRVVFTEIYAPFPDAESVVTTTLTDEDGKTRLNATSKYPSKEIRDMVLSTGMERGAGLSYDRLDEVAMGLQR